MQTIVVLIGITLSASQNAPIAPESVESLKLENRVLRLDICRSPAPFIERLTHKVSGRAVVAAPGSRNLFSITLRTRMASRRRSRVLQRASRT